MASLSLHEVRGHPTPLFQGSWLAPDNRFFCVLLLDHHWRRLEHILPFRLADDAIGDFLLQLIAKFVAWPVRHTVAVIPLVERQTAPGKSDHHVTGNRTVITTAMTIGRRWTRRIPCWPVAPETPR